MTDKQRYLLSRLSDGITLDHIKAMCRAWGIDAVFLPIGRGIDERATIAKIAEHVLDNDKSEE